MLFQLLLYQLCFSGLRLHNPFCYMACTWNATQKLGLNILNKIRELMRMRNNINKIKCGESAKKCSSRLDWINELQPNKSFYKRKGLKISWTSSRVLLSEITLLLSPFPSSKGDRSHLHFCSPIHPKKLLFLPLLFLCMKT